VANYGRLWHGCGRLWPGCGAAGPGQVRPTLHHCFGAPLYGSFLHCYSHICVPTSKNTNKAHGTSLVPKICMKFVISSSHSWDNDSQIFVVRTVNRGFTYSGSASRGGGTFSGSVDGGGGTSFLTRFLDGSLDSMRVLEEEEDRGFISWFRRWWCWCFLIVAVDVVFNRLGFILTRQRTIRRTVTHLGIRVCSGELLATKTVMWSQGDVWLFIFYSKYQMPNYSYELFESEKNMNCLYFY
jgi:hypothetical protein